MTFGPTPDSRSPNSLQRLTSVSSLREYLRMLSYERVLGGRVHSDLETKYNSGSPGKVTYLFIS